MTSLLNYNVLLEAGLAAGQAARDTKERKHEENDAELGWVCVPMVVEAYRTCVEDISKRIIFAFGLSHCDHFKQVKRSRM